MHYNFTTGIFYYQWFKTNTTCKVWSTSKLFTNLSYLMNSSNLKRETSSGQWSTALCLEEDFTSEVCTATLIIQIDGRSMVMWSCDGEKIFFCWCILLTAVVDMHGGVFGRMEVWLFMFVQNIICHRLVLSEIFDIPEKVRIVSTSYEQNDQ